MRLYSPGAVAAQLTSRSAKAVEMASSCSQPVCPDDIVDSTSASSQTSACVTKCDSFGSHSADFAARECRPSKQAVTSIRMPGYLLQGMFQWRSHLLWRGEYLLWRRLLPTSGRPLLSVRLSVWPVPPISGQGVRSVPRWLQSLFRPRCLRLSLLPLHPLPEYHKSWDWRLPAEDPFHWQFPALCFSRSEPVYWWRRCTLASSSARRVSLEALPWLEGCPPPSWWADSPSHRRGCDDLPHSRCHSFHPFIRFRLALLRSHFFFLEGLLSFNPVSLLASPRPLPCDVVLDSPPAVFTLSAVCVN